jgi:hypothetical protein
MTTPGGHRWRLAAPHRLGVRLLAASALLAGGMAVAACSSVRDDLGTSSSNCYVDLAAAAAAVHGAGHLQGVRLVAVSALRSSGAQQLYQAARQAKPRPTRVCLIAYTGRFRATAVRHPLGKPTGHLAVVEVTYPGKRVIATLLSAHAPFPFPHTHVGLAAAGHLRTRA